MAKTTLDKVATCYNLRIAKSWLLLLKAGDKVKVHLNKTLNLWQYRHNVGVAKKDPSAVVKFVFSKKATKIDEIFTEDLTLTT